MKYKSTTFYLRPGAGKKEEKAFEVLKRLGKDKINFLVWMCGIVESTYQVELDKLDKKELQALMKTPTPTQDNIQSVLDKISKIIDTTPVKTGVEVQTADNFRQDTGKETGKTVNEDKTYEELAAQQIQKSSEKSLQPKHEKNDENESELSSSQANMLFEGLSGFGI